MRAVLLLAITLSSVNSIFFQSIPENTSLLKNVSAEAEREYFKIFFNRTQTFAQKTKNFAAWAKKYNVEKQLQENVSEMKKDEEKRSSKIKELISALPAALENITRIWNNQDQTYKQRHFAIYKLSREDPMLYSALAHIWNRLTPGSSRRLLLIVAQGLRPRAAKLRSTSLKEGKTA
ncbi:unnamed protein product [Heligmosomoides polygyrus]|uniref:DUF148 domain-containing protein n=1 Tax=Heligmosomoides polygyrus TaxID=6339 RepID=A0A183G7U9_HELPZ|nr:unnamed protein product [Heligmosomoides polygyrus]